MSGAPSSSSGRRPPQRGAKALPVLVVLLALAVLALHAWHYLPFLSDDSLISLRYAKRLLAGHGLSWTDGPPVEGYSNLLWILLVALLGLLGVDPITAARGLGFACNALALVAVVRCYASVGVERTSPMLAGALTLALAAPLAIWTVGGLEQPLLAALLAWAVVFGFRVLEADAPSLRQLLPASLCLALLCWTRSDGPLFTASTLVALLAVRGASVRSLRTAAALALLPALFVSVQLGFRLAYYGEWLPNPALVKLSPSWLHLRQGLLYVLEGYLFLLPISGAALAVGVLALRRPGAGARRRTRAVLLVAHAAAWSTYLALIGGELFPGFRHFTPLVVLMAFLVAEGLDWLAPECDSRRARVGLAGALAAGFAIYALLQPLHPLNHKAHSERFEWEGRTLALTLRRGFGASRPVVAVTAAGCIPYWSELPAIDLLGLNDHYLARQRPKGFGQGLLGHELGDPDYVLRRAPDLVVFHVGAPGMDLPAARGLLERPAFPARYAAVTFQAREPTTLRFVAWIRRDSERIGIRRGGSRVAIPAYLMNGNAETFAELDAAGAFIVQVSHERPARVTGLALVPGRWRLEVKGAAGLVGSVRASDSDARLLFEASLPAEFRIPGRERVPVEVEIGSRDSGPLLLRETLLTRLGS